MLPCLLFHFLKNINCQKLMWGWRPYNGNVSVEFSFSALAVCFGSVAPPPPGFGRWEIETSHPANTFWLLINFPAKTFTSRLCFPLPIDPAWNTIFKEIHYVPFKIKKFSFDEFVKRSSTFRYSAEFLMENSKRVKWNLNLWKAWIPGGILVMVVHRNCFPCWNRSIETHNSNCCW